MKNTAELLQFVFGGEPKSVTIYDDGEDREITGDYFEIDEDELILAMPDALVDLVADGMAYGVASAELPLESANLRFKKEGEPEMGVFLLDEPVDPDHVPEHFDLAIPVPGLGWEYHQGIEEFYDLDSLAALGNDGEEAPAEDGEVSMINDAEIITTHNEVPDDFLFQPFTFMTGELWGQRDRRNTHDGKWKRVEMSLIHWLNGGENNESWGLSHHPVSKHKEGQSIVPSENLDGQRKDAAVKTMYAIGIDIDSGTALDDVKATVKAAGKFAIIYTTFNHRKTKMELKHDDVMRKLKLEDSPNRTQIQEYLRLHHKDRYSREFIDEIEVVNARDHQADGLKIVLKTPPIDKFRAVFPLAEPVELSDIGSTMNAWKEKWADAVCGVAVNMLEAEFDASSCDVNRLFFTPRHAEGADWYSAVVMGEPLAFEDIQPYSKEKYVRQRKATGDPYMYDGEEGGAGNVQQYQMPKSGASLNEWHKRAKDRFLIADVIETYCADKVRTAGGEKMGTVHLECPFEHEHSSTGGTATMAMNPDANKEGVWTIFCRHDACSGRHKLEFLQQMLIDEWFPEDVLTDDTFLLPPEDGVEEEPEETPTIPAEEEAKAFGKDATDDDIIKFFKRHVKLNADTSTKNVINHVLIKNTFFKQGQLNKFWRDVEKEKAAQQIEEEMSDLENFEGMPVVNMWNEDDLVEWAKLRIASKNAASPFMFHYMEGVARVTQNSEGFWRIKLLSEPEYGAELNKFTKWQYQTISGDQVKSRNVLAPKHIISQMYYDLDAVYPQLKAVTSSPSFTADGKLIDTPGYDPSGIFYQPDITFDMPKIPTNPTEDDIDAALRLLVEEVLADFPFAGKERDEIVEECLNGDGIPAVTHAICMLLLFFCRDMIDGPTPGHLFCKPTPGTGASLLTETLSIIGNGEVVAASELPDSKEELKKTITAFLVKGSPMIYFDNINHAVDSGGLAMALTSSRHEDRILGQTKIVDVPVRSIWVLTGNNVQMTGELLRRCVLVDLDARMPEPEKRVGWRHQDIRRWVTEQRGQLVHACLTLIQNWIAKGRPDHTGVVLNSYENWSNVMGGIMAAADIGGFLGNLSELKQMSSDGRENDIIYLVEEWWEHFNCRGKDDWINARVVQNEKGDREPSIIDLAIMQNIQLGGVRKQQDANGDPTYNPQMFETFLTRYQGRVFELEDGTQVIVRKSSKMTKHGYKWKLELNE